MLETERPDDAEVRLRPVLGVAPTVYVPALYAVALVVLLFVALVLPGIRNHGSMMTVVSTPPGAAVYLGDHRLGGTPGEFFVPSGTQRIEIRRPGFESRVETIDVGGRLFGSWLFPRRHTLRVHLELPDPDSLVDAALLEYSRWSLGGEATGQYQFPPIARALAADLAAADDGEEHLLRFARAALPHAASQALLADLLAGLATGPSGIPSPRTIASAVQFAAGQAERAPLFALQFADLLPADSARALGATEWGSGAASGLAALRSASALVGERGLPDASASIRLVTGPLGMTFAEFPAASLVLAGQDRAVRGGDLPYPAELRPFALGLTEVTNAEYARFLAAVPEWRLSNLPSLVAARLVDSDYLGGVEPSTLDPELPVTGVSWYAAVAFAGWLSALPATGGRSVRLPTEAEYDLALAAGYPRGQVGSGAVFLAPGRQGPEPVGRSGAATTGVLGLVGNVWEWMGDGFAPYGHLHRTDAPAAAAHRVLRGGGWANNAAGFRVGDRGSLDPAWCSPYVGFRVVLVDG